MIPEREDREHEDYVEYLIQSGQELNGLSLEQLGYEPWPEDFSVDERHLLAARDLEWMESVTPEQRDRSLFQAKLLAGALREASAVLIDQLFEDVAAPSSPQIWRGVRGWTHPSCGAQEPAVRCLLDQVEVIQDLYGLDLEDGWRGQVEEHLFEDDVEQNMQLGLAPMNLTDWFEPFNHSRVPALVR
jgi:hypothetical protein